MMPTKQMQEVLDEFAGFNAPPPNTVTPEIARQLPTMADAAIGAFARHMTARALKPVPMPVGAIEHKLIPGPEGDILLRVYKPEGTGPFPVLVYFHGGGWVIANLDTYDSSCRALCKGAECAVVSVAYRQAPEHPYPAAVNDAFASWQWVTTHAAEIGGDPARIAVGGESAGGNLAAVVSQLARDRRGTMPLHQLLVYPVTNFAFDTPSYQEHAMAKPLGKELMMWFWTNYLLSEADGENPKASPLRAQDFAGLPPATVITAEIDPLCSEGETYAERLRDAGVDVTSSRYEGVTHEFFGMAAVIDEAKEAVEEASERLKSSFTEGARRDRSAA